MNNGFKTSHCSAYTAWIMRDKLPQQRCSLCFSQNTKRYFAGHSAIPHTSGDRHLTWRVTVQSLPYSQYCSSHPPTPNVTLGRGSRIAHPLGSNVAIWACGTSLINGKQPADVLNSPSNLNIGIVKRRAAGDFLDMVIMRALLSL